MHYRYKKGDEHLPSWIKDLDFSKDKGLIPAVIQHDITGKVLMLGYMNEDALKQTMRDGVVCFYSRSKQRLWVKGETSSHFLHLVSLSCDCDRDALVVAAIPQGPTCHLGVESCFQGFETKSQWLWQLEDIIKGRQSSLSLSAGAPEDTTSSQKSYTQELLCAGVDQVLQKFGEEAVETLVAASMQTQERMVSEVADLLYHLLVLLRVKGVELKDIQAELLGRARSRDSSKQ